MEPAISSLVTTPLTVEPAVAGDGVAVYLGECVAVLRALPDASVDAVVTDSPYAIRSTLSGVEMFVSDLPGVCDACGENDRAAGFDRCPDCLNLAQNEALLAAPTLGMQSRNWHEKATHSRGYADNDPVLFQRWCRLWANECLRILKPGGHLLAFGGTRIWHRVAVEDAGFEIRDRQQRHPTRRVVREGRAGLAAERFVFLTALSSARCATFRA